MNRISTFEPARVAECDMVMQGSATAADLMGDGSMSFLTAAYQAIIAVDARGNELWRFPTDYRYMTCPALLEREGEPALIYAGDMAHSPATFRCIDGTGKEVWQAETGQIFWSAPALADLKGDGTVAVVQGDADGTLHAWNALTGEVIWEARLDGECSSAAVGDLDGNGSSEIIIATTTGRLYLLDADGAITREIVLGGTVVDPVGEYAAYRVAAPVLFENSKGERCIAASVQEPGSRRFLCLDARGDLMWESPAEGGVAATISVADFNGDGRADLFAITQSGRLYRWDEDGRVLWNVDTQGFGYAPGAIADIDGDGELEYVVCTELGAVLAFNQDGEIIASGQLDSRRANRAAPAFGATPDGKLSFALTGSDTGRMYLFDTPADANARMEWTGVRGGPRSTGTWFGLGHKDAVTMAPENLAWDQVLTTDEVTFRVTNPKDGTPTLEARATMTAPDGSRSSAVGPIIGAKGVLKLPVSILAPGTYSFAWSVVDTTGRKLTGGDREVTFTPFENDRAVVARAIIALENAVGGALAGVDRGIRGLMERERAAIEAESANLARLQKAVPGSAPMFLADVAARTKALTERAKRARALAELAPEIMKSYGDSPVVPFIGRTWENRGVDMELPEDVVSPLIVERRCVAGEHEPVSIKLLNVTPDTTDVRVKVDSPEGVTALAHEVKPVPTNPDQGTVAWDPLVPIRDIDAVRIPSFETREVWVDFDLRGAQPGRHTVVVTFSIGEREIPVEITLDVMEFEMAPYDAMRLCMWASYNEHTVPDLLAHGNTIFNVGVPKAIVAGDGTVKVDFTDLDAFVEPLLGHDVFLLLTGVPDLGVDWETAAYDPLLKSYLAQVMSHLAEKGIPEEHVGLYTWDEVGGHGWDAVRRYVRFGRKALAARPGVKIYINGGGDLPMFEEMDEVAGIWSPAFFMLDDDTPLMDFIRNSDAELWTYNCSYMYARPLGWNNKAINVVGECRMQAVFATRYGATGIGYWCYNIGPCMWEPAHAEYPIVYHTDAESPITVSRRWEAIRESVEDARIVVALRGKLTDETVSDDAKEKIRRLVEVTLPAMADKSLGEMHLGTARYVLDDTNDEAMVSSFRQELMDCVAAVCGRRA